MTENTFHSPLCRISWTDVVHGTQHFNFGPGEPVELRFGLELDESFWSSAEFNLFFVFFRVFEHGELIKRFDHDGDAAKLPGAPGTQLWIGLALGRADQAVRNVTGLAQFRPEIWFHRVGGSSGNLSEFAVAPHDHAFAVGPLGDDFGFPSEALVGGAGIPDGTPMP